MGSIGEEKPVIPIIDISPFFAPGASQQDQDKVVESVRFACNTYGFFQLTGHGVSKEDQTKIMECAKLFFTLPMEERMKIEVKNSMGSSFRGYEPPKIQVHQEGLKPDTKETFIFGREVPADHPDAGSFSTGPNQWPESLPDDEFRNPIMDYQGKMMDLVKKICTILALGLPKEFGQSPKVFDPLTVEPSIPMRLLHYAPQPYRDEAQFGVGDHTDFGCIAILLQQPGTDGLEVLYPPTNTWIPVPVVEDAYVINMGDTMHKWTGGYYRSARHRVIEPLGNKHRYSAPFFLNGNLKLKIRPMNDPSAEETEIGEHIMQRLSHTIGGASGDQFRQKAKAAKEGMVPPGNPPQMAATSIAVGT